MPNGDELVPGNVLPFPEPAPKPLPVHQTGCACVICERVRTALAEAPAWDKKHAKCVEKMGVPFAYEPFRAIDKQWMWKVCPCGVKHLRQAGTA